MILLYENIHIVAIYGDYVMALFILNLEMIEHAHKYFCDFINFSSLVIRHIS
jgi:hypothetical protein